MRELPVISGERCVSGLERVGYRVARIKGSHIRMTCAGRKPVTVPRHRELDRGTLKAILRTAGLSVEEFTNLL